MSKWSVVIMGHSRRVYFGPFYINPNFFRHFDTLFRYRTFYVKENEPCIK